MVQLIERRSERDVVRDALEAIQARQPDGLLTVEAVVGEAEDPGHELHRKFTWDNTVAGHNWRLHEARVLIRSVELVEATGSVEPFPKYFSLLQDRGRAGGGYRRTQEIINSESLMAEMERTAKKELAGWVRRNAMCTELVDAVRRAAGINEPVQPRARRQRRRGSEQ